MYGTKLLGLEQTTELYRGASAVKMRCDQDWPPELSPRPTLRLSWSSDGGWSWTLWRHDVDANFIDLPAIDQCLIRLSAPEIAPADTAGPFRVLITNAFVALQSRVAMRLSLKIRRWMPNNQGSFPSLLHLCE